MYLISFSYDAIFLSFNHLSVCMNGQQGASRSKEEQQTQKYFLKKMQLLLISILLYPHFAHLFSSKQIRHHSHFRPVDTTGNIWVHVNGITFNNCYFGINVLEWSILVFAYNRTQPDADLLTIVAN